jgi:Lrp/AsnC family transcriptional regulator, leucine-responsive regulatory protein
MKRSLDEIDKQILDLLEVNGRETASALAGKIGMSRSALQDRIMRLERDGEILGYTIKRKTPSDAFGVRAYLMIKTNGALCHQIAPYLMKIPEVKFFDSISGEIDGLICIETKNNESLGALRDIIASYHQVKEIQTLSVMQIRIPWRR